MKFIAYISFLVSSVGLLTSCTYVNERGIDDYISVLNVDNIKYEFQLMDTLKKNFLVG